MPVVSISVPSDLFRELEEKKGKRSRSGAWADYLQVGTKMDGHRCPAPPMPKWPDDHQCPDELTDWFRDGRKRFPNGWVGTIDGKKYHVKPDE